MKKGIKYFTLPSVLDRRYQRLEARCGFASHSVLLYVFRQIFGVEGYFSKWEEEDSLMLAHSHSIDAEYVTNVVNTAIDVGLFDKELYEKYLILTSEEIQENYLEATKRCKYSSINEDYRLIEKKESKKNVYNSENNADISKQRKGNKIKSNENKLNEIKGENEPSKDGSLACADAHSFACASVSACGSPSKKENTSFAESVVESYNRLCPSLSPVINVTSSRTCAVGDIREFIDKHGGFEKYFEKVARSDFLCGKNDRSWKATFDWLMKRDNAAKVIEGNFESAVPAKSSSFDTNEFFAAALRRSEREHQELMAAKGSAL